MEVDLKKWRDAMAKLMPVVHYLALANAKGKVAEAYAVSVQLCSRTREQIEADLKAIKDARAAKRPAGINTRTNPGLESLAAE